MSLPFSIASAVSDPCLTIVMLASANLLETSFFVGSVTACGLMKTNACILPDGRFPDTPAMI